MAQCAAAYHMDKPRARSIAMLPCLPGAAHCRGMAGNGRCWPVVGRIDMRMLW